MNKYLGEFYGCGCGGADEPDEEDVERILREIEEEREREGIPVVIPVTPERIAAPNWPIPKKVEVETR